MTTRLSPGVRSEATRLVATDVFGVPRAPNAFTGGRLNWNASSQRSVDGVPFDELPLALVKVIVCGSGAMRVRRIEASAVTPATTSTTREPCESVERLGGSAKAT